MACRAISGPLGRDDTLRDHGPVGGCKDPAENARLRSMSKARNIKKQAKRSEADVAFSEGSDNPFADMGFANPELELAKSRLVMEIGRVVEERALSQVAAGRIIG